MIKSYNFCLIRLNARSDFVIADKEKVINAYIPYHPRLPSLRFTDRVFASALFFYLRNDLKIPENDDWVRAAIKLTSK